MKKILLISILLTAVSIFSIFSVDIPSVFTGTEITPDMLYRSALDKNIDLQKLDIERKQADIDRKNAEASAFPTVEFQTSLTYQTTPMIEPIKLTAGQLGAYDIGGSSILLPSEDMTIYEGMENTHYEFKLIVDQPVFTWGKITNSVLLYQDIAQISGLKTESSRNGIRTRIYIYAYTLNFIEKIEERLANQAKDAERFISIADESYQNGFILYTDLLKARIQAKELQIAQAEITKQKEAAILSLSQLSGIRNIDIDNLDFSFIRKIEDISLQTAGWYLDSALKNSPEIQMLNIIRNINELKVKISEGAGYFKPDIGLHFELGYTGPRFPFIEADWFGKDSLGLNSTIALQTILYDGGKIAYQIERDTQELNKAFHEYELGVDQIYYFINETLLTLELNRQNIEYYRLLQENDQQQIELRRTQFEAGSGDETAMLAEQIQLNTNMIKEHREMIDFYKNYFALIGAASAFDDSLK
ncbi:MAG: TolC family protein [Spirochaetales bacterium]|nr:TolC family protein [Spirochaetales bacterium]